MRIKQRSFDAFHKVFPGEIRALLYLHMVRAIIIIPFSLIFNFVRCLWSRQIISDCSLDIDSGKG